MSYLLKIRKFTSLTLLIAWLVTAVTGTLLLISSLLARLGYYLPPALPDLHTYAGFVALGISVIHITLNWNALKTYVVPRKKK